MQSFPTMVFLILLRAHKTFLLKPNLRGKDFPRQLRPILVIYKTKVGRLL